MNRAVTRAARSAIAYVCSGSGGLAFWERLESRSLTVLTYHRILPAYRKYSYLNPDLVVTPESFRVHCRVLQKYFAVLPLSQAVDMMVNSAAHHRPPERIATITFDDGYRDNILYAAPILAELGLRATFFPVVDLIGASAPPWYDRLARALSVLMREDKIEKWWAELPAAFQSGHARAPSLGDALGDAKRLAPLMRVQFVELAELEAGAVSEWPAEDLVMSWEELKKLVSNGHEIGSHSATHPILPSLDDGSLAKEISGSRLTLEKGLGVTVTSFCYPNGDWDTRVLQAIESGGYRCAVTTMSGNNRDVSSPHRLRRWFIDEDRLKGVTPAASTALLRMHLSGLADRVFLRGARMSGEPPIA
jgi:peptidoglycan/xylan/chitin deacetylase (PgdA/CDA1 family)